jgi:hypothetical protein
VDQKAPQQLFETPGLQTQANFGFAEYWAKQVLDEISRKSRHRAHAQLLNALPLSAPNSRHQFLAQAKYSICVVKNRRTEFGEHQAPAGSIKERSPQIAFELANLSRERRLRNTQLTGGTRQVPHFGYLPEVEQMPKIQVLHVLFK